MGQHTCHLPGCKTACAPRYLMCPKHWFQAPGHLQADVYATVKKRNPHVDASWAPWWRAQTQCIAAVLRKLGENPMDVMGLELPADATQGPLSWAKWVDAWEAHGLGFADQLEAKSNP